MAQTSVSGDNRIDALLTTRQWGSVNGNSISLTYSFPTSSSTWLSNYQAGEPFSPYTVTYLNSTQKQYVRDAVQLWSNVANINFTEVTEPSIQGDIRLTYSTIVTGSTAGYAYVPPSTSVVLEESGDIWLNPDPDLTDLSPGGQGFSTVLHELGHALGLKHPFDTQTDNTVVLTGSENSTQYSVMSYTDYEAVGWTEIGNSNTFLPTQNTEPMLYDILAMQYLYGANTNYNTGDNTYTFSDTKAELKTIWDAGGTDTFDLSTHSHNLVINLNAGQYSSLGVVTAELVNGSIRLVSKVAVDNVAIAFDVEIENAIGGTGDDTITGNALDNEITGGQGDDIIDGGAGNDTVIYTGNKSAYLIETINSNLQITSLSSNEGVDTLTGVETLKFADQSVATTTTSIPTTPAEVDITPTEGNSNHTNYFLLQISEALSEDSSVSYTTRDGTAIAGQDYIAASGIATITAGETSTVIGIDIIGDSVIESNETFLLAISNPQGGVFPSGITEITATRTIVDDDSSSSNILSELQIIGVDTAVTV